MSKDDVTQPPVEQDSPPEPAPPSTPAPTEGDVIRPADEGDDPPIKK